MRSGKGIKSVMQWLFDEAFNDENFRKAEGLD